MMPAATSAPEEVLWVLFTRRFAFGEALGPRNGAETRSTTTAILMLPGWSFRPGMAGWASSPAWWWMSCYELDPAYLL